MYWRKVATTAPVILAATGSGGELGRDPVAVQLGLVHHRARSARSRRPGHRRSRPSSGETCFHLCRPSAAAASTRAAGSRPGWTRRACRRRPSCRSWPARPARTGRVSSSLLDAVAHSRKAEVACMPSWLMSPPWSVTRSMYCFVAEPSSAYSNGTNAERSVDLVAVAPGVPVGEGLEVVVGVGHPDGGGSPPGRRRRAGSACWGRPGPSSRRPRRHSP